MIIDQILAAEQQFISQVDELTPRRTGRAVV
jgi:hypothetical protein